MAGEQATYLGEEEKLAHHGETDCLKSLVAKRVLWHVAYPADLGVMNRFKVAAKNAIVVGIEACEWFVNIASEPLFGCKVIE